ncbi:hypothetical protein EDC96DRAFT_550311 [Choanephora cucurbitarum]|nr:hypothetical protein EDC96DRAFT_550311 [Choanephora cucurbitarum]
MATDKSRLHKKVSESFQNPPVPDICSFVAISDLDIHYQNLEIKTSFGEDNFKKTRSLDIFLSFVKKNPFGLFDYFSLIKYRKNIFGEYFLYLLITQELEDLLVEKIKLLGVIEESDSQEI